MPNNDLLPLLKMELTMVKLSFLIICHGSWCAFFSPKKWLYFIIFYDDTFWKPWMYLSIFILSSLCLLVFICFEFLCYTIFFQVFYSRKASLILHSLPTVIYLLLPFLLHFPAFAPHLAFATLMDLVKGTMLHCWKSSLTPMIFFISHI